MQHSKAVSNSLSGVSAGERVSCSCTRATARHVIQPACSVFEAKRCGLIRVRRQRAEGYGRFPLHPAVHEAWHAARPRGRRTPRWLGCTRKWRCPLVAAARCCGPQRMARLPLRLFRPAARWASLWRLGFASTACSTSDARLGRLGIRPWMRAGRLGAPAALAWIATRRLTSRCS